MKNQHPFVQSIYEMRQALNELSMIIKLKESMPPEYKLFNNDEILKLFSISANTAQKWREDGILKHFKIKGKIYYRFSDVQVLIDNHSK